MNKKYSFCKFFSFLVRANLYNLYNKDPNSLLVNKALFTKDKQLIRSNKIIN